MSGQILIVDTVATNRIVLKVKLASAFLKVEQASTAAQAIARLQINLPDIIILGGNMPDMSVLDMCRRLKACERTSQIPLIVVSDDPKRQTRLDTLRAGADEFLTKPVADDGLLARIRSLMRARDSLVEMRLRDSIAHMPGLADPRAGFEVPAAVVLAAQTGKQGQHWRAMLGPRVPYRLRKTTVEDAIRDMSQYPTPDAFVVAVCISCPEVGLRFLAELRSRRKTRHAAVLVVLDHDDDLTSINALDLGANDVMSGPFDSEEAALRLDAIIQRKRLTDRLRQSVEAGLSAAVTDSLTGLYNRRYALPKLSRIAQQSGQLGEEFAVMVADLDHFKSVNDKYGHTSGDIVLSEVARRLRAALGEADLIARIGGEEFLVVLQRTSPRKAEEVAARLCEIVRKDPVYIRDRDIQIPVTISIGVAMAAPNHLSLADERLHQMALCSDECATATRLIDLADQALYGAKAEGRDQFTLCRPAA